MKSSSSAILACCLSFLLALSPAVLSAQTVTVISVIDGDTLLVRLDGAKKKIRLIGIDAPETEDNPKLHLDAKRTHIDEKIIISKGRSAAAEVSKLAPKDSEVRLELDQAKYDKFGRVLAYVYLPSGEMLNEVLVRKGYARLMIVPPDVRYVKRLKQAQAFARQNRLGIWHEN